jgi:hypothetical protein
MLTLGADNVPGLNQTATIYPTPRVHELASVNGLVVFWGLNETSFWSRSSFALPGRPIAGVAAITRGSNQGESILCVLTGD